MLFGFLDAEEIKKIVCIGTLEFLLLSFLCECEIELDLLMENYQRKYLFDDRI